MVAKSGSGWKLAAALITLEEQVNKKWPQRAKGSDGSIGDLAHASRTSDHNVRNGYCHALDITHDPHNGFDSYKFADMILAKQDSRLSYVISNGRIGSGPKGVQPGVWRKYNGSNAHAHHVHVSTNDLGEKDTKPWVFDQVVIKPQPTAPVEMARELFYGLEGADVAALQSALGLTPNSFFGYGTAAAVVKVQQEAGLAAHGIVGPGTWKIIMEKSK
jgi:hypothetical protein